MQINDNTTMSFYGYKNIITNREMFKKNEGFTFLSMQLDNIGHKDLDIWKNIQKNLLNITKPSDTFTLELMKQNDYVSLAYADKRLAPSGFRNSAEKENLMFKAYTWMANITKRMMNDNKLVMDKSNGQMTNVFRDTVNNISSIFGNNYPTAMNFVTSALAGKYHPQEIALDMNKAIDKIMCEYLL